MAELPTTAVILNEYAELEQYLYDGRTIGKYSANALLDVKRYLLNNRGIKWSTIYSETDGDYLADSDGLNNNRDQMHKAIALLTCADVFKANAQQAQDSSWWSMYLSYREDAENLLDTAKLDIDTSGSGTIEDSEERDTGQRFFIS